MKLKQQSYGIEFSFVNSDMKINNTPNYIHRMINYSKADRIVVIESQFVRIYTVPVVSILVVDDVI